MINELRIAKRDKNYLVKKLPKIIQLKSVLVDHFKRHLKCESSTRCLIFCNTRETVSEVKVQLSDVNGTTE